MAERSPRHQLLTFNSCGQLINKFGGQVLQNPRAIAADAFGNIIVVESRVMRLVVFDMHGEVNAVLLDDELKFPNGVAANGNRIYVSDNRTHSVHLYTLSNGCIQKVGDIAAGLYPVGVYAVGPNTIGSVSNYNRLKLTVSTICGEAIRRCETSDKFSECCGVAPVTEKVFAVVLKVGKIVLFGYDV